MPIRRKCFISYHADQQYVDAFVKAFEESHDVFIARQLGSMPKLNDIDPQARLADVLARLPDHPAKRPRTPAPQRAAAESRLSTHLGQSNPP